jgi:ribosomal protein L34E
MLKLPRFAPGKAMVDYLLRGHAYCAECKGRLTGTMLNRRFRYYRCSHTKPTSTRPATCRQSYINASKLEQIVWKSVKEVLSKPEHIKSQVRQIVKGESDSSRSESQFEREIAKLRKRIKSYNIQHKRLLRHVQHDTFSKDNVLDAINQLKAEKAEAEGQITELTETKKRLQQLREAEVKLDDWCALAQQNIEDADNGTKRLAFTMLDLKVYATRDKVDIKGIIPVDLVTIAQTSG